tara:strand:- start:2024 stop:2728 length:705 start_codon:yes stop_codon:yes gene_type:complete
MKKMVKRHLKRLTIPNSWKVQKKTNKFIARPLPGAHNFSLGMPIIVILRDLLKLANTRREVRYILNNQDILIDNIKRKDEHFIAGFMDTLSIPLTKKFFRILINKSGELSLKPAKESEINIKPCKIIGKTLLKNKKIQINLEDSRNIIVDKGEYKTGDSLLIELPSQKIKEHIKLEKGAVIFLTGGHHVGETGKIVDIKDDRVVYKLKSGEQYESLKIYAFVVGKEKPSIELEE